MLSAKTIGIIKATVPALSAHGETLTRHFYRRMFAGDPAVKAFFNPAHQHSGTQQRALAAAICAYATHIENPAVLADAVELIAQKHCSLQVQAEHYPIVGKHLLGSIREVLGEAATDDVINAWAEAYGLLADILIKREAEIYEQQRVAHGWEGMKRFIVRRKQVESATITSFYLYPADGATLRPFQPGQYITVRIPTADGSTTMRNYSLSGKTDQPYYRISVKREGVGDESQGPGGYVSNFLHDRVGVGDTIEVGAPCGEFTLQPPSAPHRPLVLISGGVGITPILSMLHAALDAKAPKRDVWFIHGSVDGESHAFCDEVDVLTEKHPQLRVHFRYSRPNHSDRKLAQHDSEGFIDLWFLESILEGPDADFYFCGPKPMMASVYQGLTQWGVPAEQMHYEFFGPAEALKQAPVARATEEEEAAVA
jgi:nitric oxide dioxygenase